MLYARLQHLIILMIIWASLMEPANMCHHPYLSAVSILTVYFISCYFKLLPCNSFPIIGFILYFVWLMFEVIKSAIKVTIMIWRDNLSFNSCMIWVECPSLSEVEQVIYANSITLTPGTAVVEAEKGRVMVHILNIGDNMQDIFKEMENKVLRIKC